MKRLAPLIGIGFGRSTSKMAWYNTGTDKAEILINDQGEIETPSIVCFDEEQVIVGKEAERMLEDAEVWDRVIVGLPPLTAPVINGLGRVVKWIDVAAAILRKLKRNAEELHFQEEVTRAVITHPVSFNIMERDKLREAALLAGFREADLLAEPVAAAIGYTQVRVSLAINNYILVYHLGGKTFELAVLAHGEDGSFRLALAPQSIKHIGGDDFDRVLYQDARLPMRAAAFAPTGTWLAVGGDDGIMRLWNGFVCQNTGVINDSPICIDTPMRLQSSHSPIRSLAWSPDARYLASSGDDGSFSLWDPAQSQKPLLTMSVQPGSAVHSLAWSPAGNQLATASGKIVIVWDLHAA
jgi:Hsp70 protein/WD40 domain-containing protein